MLRANSREPLFAFRLPGQKVEDTRALEDLAHPGTGVGNPQPAVHGRRHVERSDELAHSGGIDPGDRREIENDRPFTLPKQSADAVARRSIDRHTKCACDGNDAGTLAMQLKHYAQFAPSCFLRLHRLSNGVFRYDDRRGANVTVQFS